jgi:hypothetical protein
VLSRGQGSVLLWVTLGWTQVGRRHKGPWTAGRWELSSCGLRTPEPRRVALLNDWEGRTEETCPGEQDSLHSCSNSGAYLVALPHPRLAEHGVFVTRTCNHPSPTVSVPWGRLRRPTSSPGCPSRHGPGRPGLTGGQWPSPSEWELEGRGHRVPHCLRCFGLTSRWHPWPSHQSAWRPPCGDRRPRPSSQARARTGTQACSRPPCPQGFPGLASM